jgi:hypothetical protein
MVYQRGGVGEVHPDEAEDLEFDEANESHLAEGHVTIGEVTQVWLNAPKWVPNMKGRTGTWLMLGRTDGGRPLFIPVTVDEVRSRVRPIGGRTCDKDEVARWLRS